MEAINAAADTVLGGMTVTALIVLIIQFLKAYKLSSNFVPLVAAVLGIILTITQAFAMLYPAFGQWVNLTIKGFTTGLTAIGFFAANQHYQKQATEAALKQTAADEQTVTTATTVATPEKVVTEVDVAPLKGGQGNG